MRLVFISTTLPSLMTRSDGQSLSGQWSLGGATQGAPANRNGSWARAVAVHATNAVARTAARNAPAVQRRAKPSAERNDGDSVMVCAPARGAAARTHPASRRTKKFALRPLGFGRTKTRAPSIRSSCSPSATGVPGRRPKTDRNRVTPTKATTSGLTRRIFLRRTFAPATYSSGRSVSMPGVGRGIRFVIPNPHSGSRSSSSRTRSARGRAWTRYKSFQKRFESRAK